MMFNFCRWFPQVCFSFFSLQRKNLRLWLTPSQNKVVFLAPTKPLVSQQIEACFGVLSFLFFSFLFFSFFLFKYFFLFIDQIMGMTQDDMCEMTGQTKPERRKELWEEKKLFFLTPQVLVNDLKVRIFQF